MPQNELSAVLFELITTIDFDTKIKLGQSLASGLGCALTPLSESELTALKTPGRPQGFQIVLPRNVPKRNMADPQTRIHFLHAIANIELLAIELPALCLLRFGSQDLDFVANQLHIIAEEARHFELLRNRLRDWDCEFGSIAVHHGLWDYAWQCQNEIEHQILIPCYLEARGLDVTPDFVKKFQDLGDEKTASIMQLILDEEIRHVQHGMTYLQKMANVSEKSPDEVFEQTLRRFFGDKLKSKIPLNRYYRSQAGFSTKQMDLLGS